MHTNKDHAPGSTRVSHSDASVSLARTTTEFDRKFECRPFAFSNLQTLFPTQNQKPPHFHKLAHSSLHGKKITPTFPSTSPLFVRSSAAVQMLTPLFSSAPA